MAGKLDDTAIANLIRKLAHERRVRKALAIGAADGHRWIISLALGLASDGVLIVFHPDADRMRILRDEFDRASVAARAHVMLGNPALLVSKVAGPFDFVLNCIGGEHDAWRTRLLPLVAPGGVLASASVEGIRIEVTPRSRVAALDDTGEMQ